MARTNASVGEVLGELNALRHRSADGNYDLSVDKYRNASQEELLKLVYEEAVREVGMENGCEYFMAVRLPFGRGYPLLFLYNENFAWNRICWPIPQDELLYNNQMVQNPLTDKEK